MDLDAVKDWYRKGLVGKNDLVLTPGGARWVPLRSAIKLVEGGSSFGSPAAASAELRAAVSAAVGPRRTAPARPVAAAAPRTDDVQAWRSVAAAVLLFGGAAVSGVFAFLPDRWLPTLDAAPWRDLALGQTALGLMLVRGWELGRKLARLLVLLAAFAVFPLAGILLAQGVRGAPLAVMASAVVIGVGLVALLAGSWLSGLRSATSAAAVLAGWAGVLYFGVVPSNPDSRRIREAAASEDRVADPASGLTLAAPASWLVLRADQDLVPPAPGTRAVLGQPRLGGLAVLAAESPRDVPSLDAYLAHLLDSRGLPGLVESDRSDVALGALLGRQVLSRWERQGQRYVDVTVAAKDGHTYWSLAAWAPDDGSSRPALELAALVKGLSLTGAMAARVGRALEAVVREVPQLSARAADVLMAAAGSRLPDPPQVFRRSCELASRGPAALSEAETQELTALHAAAAATLSPRERTRLAAYFERLRRGAATTPDEDGEMARLMKGAVLRLRSAQLARLQALYEKVIRHAVGG